MVAAVMVLGAVLFMTTSSTSQALAYSVVFGFGLGGILSVPPVAYADYYGRRSLGAIRGVTEPLTSFGQAIGALAAGAIFDLTGSYQYAFVAFAALGASTMLMVQLARPPKYVPEAAPEGS
jgi:MFS family permease